MQSSANLGANLGGQATLGRDHFPWINSQEFNGELDAAIRGLSPEHCPHWIYSRKFNGELGAATRGLSPEHVPGTPGALVSIGTNSPGNSPSTGALLCTTTSGDQVAFSESERPKLKIWFGDQTEAPQEFDGFC